MPEADDAKSARADSAGRGWPGVAAVGLLFFVVIAFFSSVDAVLAPASPPVGAPATSDAREAPAAGEKTLVLFVDSLAFDRTLDARLMKHLAGFKAEGVWAKSSGSRDQVTVPAVRAAFTGSDQFRIFGFVENFWTRATAFDSIFRQWNDSGKRVLVYSDDAFEQFGRAGITHRPIGEPVGGGSLSEHQHALYAQALREWASESWDVLIFHATFLDEVSHHTRAGSATYRQAFTDADTWVGEAMRATKPDQNLLVMGDHGHNARGVHTMGMNIHTFVGIRGPRFARNFQLEEQPITLVRYLASWATGVPLSSAYQGRRLPEALVVPPGYRLPAAFAEGVSPPRHVEPTAWQISALTALAAALFGLWVLGVRRAWGWADVGVLAAACSTTLAAQTSPSLFPLAAVAAVAAFGVRAYASARRSHRDALAALASAALAAAMVGYGYLLAKRVLDESVSWEGGFRVYVLVALAITALFCALVGPKWGTLITFASAMLLLPTTNYPWGSVSVWAPAFLLLTLVHGVARWFRRYQAPSAPWPLAEKVTGVLALVVIAWIVQRFWVSVSWDFLFRRFEPFSRSLSAGSQFQWALGSCVAKLVVLLKWRRDWRLHATALAGVAALTCYEIGVLPRASIWNGGFVAGLVVLAALWPRSIADTDTRRELRDTLLLVALFAAFFFSVKNVAKTHFWLSYAAAALALCARLLSRMREDVRRAGHVVLLCFGVIISGWVGVCWSMTHVEWDVLSAHFGADQMRSRILVFLPALVLRYAIPVLVFRLVLHAQLGPADRSQRDWLWTALGLKVAAVAASTFGIGLAIGTTAFFLEGVQHAAILLVLALGLIGMTGAAGAAGERETSFFWGLTAALVPGSRRVTRWLLRSAVSR